MYPARQSEFHRGWFVGGAVALSGIAGFTNSAMFQLSNLAVSHLTGSITRVSVDIARREYSSMVPFTVILGCFFAGAAMSGAVVGNKEFGVGRRYAVMLVVQAGLLAVAAVLASRATSTVSLGFAAVACGLQNALASSFRGMIVRTTHMTGIVTDIAFQVGRYVTTRSMDKRHLALHLPIVLSFTAGGVLGAFVEAALGPRSLFLASAASAVCGLVYYLIRPGGAV
jgi:uncharacterized membrane protein YoaK (UPF0700 family)